MPIYNPSAAGSAGGDFADWKTIGATGDYADVQAMIDAGFNKGIFLENITEDSDIAVPATNLWLNMNGFTLTMGDFQFTYVGQADLYIDLAGGEIDYTHTTGVPLIAPTTDFSIVQVENGTIDNNSTINATEFVEHTTSSQRMRNLVFELPNYSSTGLSIQNRDAQNYVENCEFIGGGFGCYRALYVANWAEPCNIKNIKFSGQYSNNFAQQIATLFLRGTQSSGIYISTLGVCYISLGGQVTNMYSEQGSKLTVQCATTSCQISNALFENADIDFGGTDEVMLTNVQCEAGGLEYGAASSNCSVTNSRFNSAYTALGDRHKFVNTEFLGGATVSNGADNLTFTGCQFGADGGGGANTLTVNATAVGTIAEACHADAAMVDNGTGSSLNYTLY